MRFPRWLVPVRWIYAFLGSYFWLPCPKCGINFGGFEAGSSSFEFPVGDGGFWICCRWCYPKEKEECF